MFRSDTEVIKRVQKGDPLAWGQLVKQNTGRGFNLCYRFVGKSDQAEELTKETFVALFKHLSAHHQVQRNLVSCIVCISRNLIIDQYRKARDVRPALSTSSSGDKALQSSSIENLNDLWTG